MISQRYFGRFSNCIDVFEIQAQAVVSSIYDVVLQQYIKQETVCFYAVVMQQYIQQAAVGRIHCLIYLRCCSAAVYTTSH